MVTGGVLSGSASTSVRAPGVAAVPGARAVGIFSIARIATFTPPSGVNERVDVTTPLTTLHKLATHLVDLPATGITTAAWAARPTGTTSHPAIGTTLTLRPAG